RATPRPSVPARGTHHLHASLRRPPDGVYVAAAGRPSVGARRYPRAADRRRPETLAVIPAARRTAGAPRGSGPRARTRARLRIGYASGTATGCSRPLRVRPARTE